MKIYSLSAGLMLLAAMLCNAFTAQTTRPPVRVLILTGASDLPYHDWRVTTPYLGEMLRDSGRFEVTVLEDVRAFSQSQDRFDVLVLNYNGPRWGLEVERRIEESVRSGTGLVALHGVSYGSFFGMELKGGRWAATRDPGWIDYADMLGMMMWKPENIGHARRHVFRVKWTDPTHPISRGLEPSFLADDELYHKMDLKPTAQVLATAYSDPAQGGTGRDEPQIWTVAFGRGRVVHITLGHDVKAMQQPGFAAGFLHATEWAATGEVTLQTAVK